MLVTSCLDLLGKACLSSSKCVLRLLLAQRELFSVLIKGLL